MPFIYLLNHRRVPNLRAPHTPTASSTTPGNHTEELSNDARISRAARPTYREHREAGATIYIDYQQPGWDTHDRLISLATFSPRERETHQLDHVQHNVYISRLPSPLRCRRLRVARSGIYHSSAKTPGGRLPRVELCRTLHLLAPLNPRPGAAASWSSDP